MSEPKETIDLTDDTFGLPPRRRKLYQRAISIYLDYHENGQSLGRVYRQLVKSYVIFVGLMGLGIYLYWINRFFEVAYLLIGFVLGKLFADYSFVRVSVALWPMLDRLFDWSRVRKLNETLSSEP
ncbi:MAG TPA: hypothetical protein VFT74_04975 [Isosphaeraceae bacterium]|nr:hypothetical protein [Isosphaeraceae bacterium]